MAAQEYFGGPIPQYSTHRSSGAFPSSPYGQAAPRSPDPYNIRALQPLPPGHYYTGPEPPAAYVGHGEMPIFPPMSPHNYANQQQMGGYMQPYNTGPDGPQDRGLGSTLVGGIGGAVLSHKMGAGGLGTLAGALGGAIMANAATNKIKKEKKKYKKKKSSSRKHHKRRSSGSSSDTSSSSDSDSSVSSGKKRYALGYSTGGGSAFGRRRRRRKSYTDSD